MDQTLQTVENIQPAKYYLEQNDPCSESATTQYLPFNQMGCAQSNQSLMKLPRPQKRNFGFLNVPIS